MDDDEDKPQDWLYEALNTLSDPRDACDHGNDEAAALRATIEDAIGQLKNLAREMNWPI